MGTIPPVTILVCFFKSRRCVGGDRAAKQAVEESPLMSWCKKPRINGQRMGKEQNPKASR